MTLAGSETVAAETAAREAFRSHLAEKAAAARLKHGLYIDVETVETMLADRDVVRWPTRLAFAADPLEPGEFAWPQPIGPDPADGYRLVIHPNFAGQPENLPLLVAYHIPTINYGPIVEAADAELYGATLLGLDVETYYRALCELADSIPR
jgi:hypothetical protein